MAMDSIVQDAACDSVNLPTIFPVAIASNPPRRESAGRGRERGSAAAGRWVGCCERSGVVEMHDPRLLRTGQEAFCRALLEAAVVDFGASRAEIDLESATCRLEFGPGRLDRAELAGRVAGAIRSATPAVGEGSGHRDADRAGWTVLTAIARDGGASLRERSRQGPDEPICVAFPVEEARRSRRLVNLAMAGGSIVLAIGGVILPGIPTLPFVIMTGRYAIRVSPRIERLLKGQPWFAAMLAEAGDSSGPNFDWRSTSRMIGLAALLVAAILVLHPPLPIVLALELGLMACCAWREMARKPGRLDPGLAAAA